MEDVEPGEIELRGFGFRKSKTGKQNPEKAGWRLIEILRIEKKGVGGFFPADGGGGAMAGIDDRLVGKHEDLFADAGKKKFAVPAG